MPKIKTYLNSANMHFWSKFGIPNFTWWGVMMCKSSKWDKFWKDGGQTCRQADAGNTNTQQPKLALGQNPPTLEALLSKEFSEIKMIHLDTFGEDQSL